MRNFRGFDDLKIENMNRINLVTGGNNSGKTSLLGALFLLAGAGNPHLTLNANVVRGVDLIQGNPEAETFWKPMFFAFDTNQYVEIEGLHSSYSRLTLHISLERREVFELPMDTPISAMNNFGTPNLFLIIQNRFRIMCRRAHTSWCAVRANLSTGYNDTFPGDNPVLASFQFARRCQTSGTAKTT